MSGMTDRQIFMLIARELGVGDGRHEELVQEACRSMVDLYATKEEADGTYVALPGVRDLLEGLRARGVVLGLVTGNVPEIASHKLSETGLAEYFSFGAFGSEGDERTVLPPLAVARDEEASGRRVHPSRVFIVGDTPRDVACAVDNGYRAIAVATGHIPIDQLRTTPAELVLESLADPEPLLKLMGISSPDVSAVAT
jgi:phosphoglycolate phosphatase-like HAD superfamily hydrolase